MRLACSRRAMWLCMPATIAVESVTSPPGATLMGGHQQSAYGLAQALLIAHHRDRECGAGHHSPLATAQAQGATRLAKSAADPRSTRRSEGGPPRLNDWEQPPRRSVPSAPRSSHEQELRATIIALVSIPSSWLMAGKKRDRPRSHLHLAAPPRVPPRGDGEGDSLIREPSWLYVEAEPLCMPARPIAHRFEMAKSHSSPAPSILARRRPPSFPGASIEARSALGCTRQTRAVAIPRSVTLSVRTGEGGPGSCAGT